MYGDLLSSVIRVMADPVVSQTERWERCRSEIHSYILTYKRLPSRHRIEDHRMLNWLKYNRRLLASGRMPQERIEKFQALLNVCSEYARVNQYAYSVNGK